MATADWQQYAPSRKSCVRAIRPPRISSREAAVWLRFGTVTMCSRTKVSSWPPKYFDS